ncbi:MAG: hypothetical protein GY861_12860 [bacterium]|nr:hypothetical protein [bacterium]
MRKYGGYPGNEQERDKFAGECPLDDPPACEDCEIAGVCDACEEDEDEKHTT